MKATVVSREEAMRLAGRPRSRYDGLFGLVAGLERDSGLVLEFEDPRDAALAAKALSRHRAELGGIRAYERGTRVIVVRTGGAS